MSLAVFAIVALVAFANGANDNFKGVATLLGSRTCEYRRALLWATVTTACGSLAAFYVASGLVTSFRGKGLVDAAIATEPKFALAVAAGAGMTVLAATRIGMPISTTHSLIGALLGAGWASGATVYLGTLGDKFVLPLLVSPLLAIAVAGVAYPILHWGRLRLGISRDICLCVGAQPVQTLLSDDKTMALAQAEVLSASIGAPVVCETHYRGRLLGVSAGAVLDQVHWLSSGLLSFARGLNDTPKIAALLLVVPAISIWPAVAIVGLSMALGGWLSAKRVASTMSFRITLMNHGQAVTANLITTAIVLIASQFGLPVSTTHVSCGSLFGIGVATGQGNRRTVQTVLVAWLVTLPVAAALGAGAYRLVGR